MHRVGCVPIASETYHARSFPSTQSDIDNNVHACMGAEHTATWLLSFDRTGRMSRDTDISSSLYHVSCPCLCVPADLVAGRNFNTPQFFNSNTPEKNPRALGKIYTIKVVFVRVLVNIQRLVVTTTDSLQLQYQTSRSTGP